MPLLPRFHLRQHLLFKPWVKRYPISVRLRSFWKDVILEPHYMVQAAWGAFLPRSGIRFWWR
jgi:hypothetical protein